MSWWWFVAATLVELHGPDGQAIHVNPEQVISIREPRHLAGANREHWPPGTRCLVTTVDGKFIITSEPCESVRKKLQTAQ